MLFFRSRRTQPPKDTKAAAGHIQAIAMRSRCGTLFLGEDIDQKTMTANAPK
jgi:hypothetical protein